MGEGFGGLGARHPAVELNAWSEAPFRSWPDVPETTSDKKSEEVWA